MEIIFIVMAVVFCFLAYCLWSTILPQFKHNQVVDLLSGLNRLRAILSGKSNKHTVELQENWQRAEKLFAKPINGYFKSLRSLNKYQLCEAISLGKQLNSLAALEIESAADAMETLFEEYNEQTGAILDVLVS